MLRKNKSQIIESNFNATKPVSEMKQAFSVIKRIAASFDTFF